MFKNVQLVLLPQHMWAENKEGREACRGRKKEVFFLFFPFFLVCAKESPYCNKCSSWPLTHLEKWKENNLSEINTCGEKKKTYFLDSSCKQDQELVGEMSGPTKKIWNPKTHTDIQRKKKVKRQQQEEKERKGEKWNSDQTSKHPFILSV